MSNQQEIPDATRTHLMLLLPMIRSRLVTELASQIEQKTLVKSLDCLFGHCLQASPESRDLDTVLMLLESSLDAPKTTIAEQKENIEPEKTQGTSAEHPVGSPLKGSYPHRVSEGTQKNSVRVFSAVISQVNICKSWASALYPTLIGI